MAEIKGTEIIGMSPDRQKYNHDLKDYDFKRPDKFSKDQIRTTQMMHETYARLCTTSMSAMLRAFCNMRVTSVDQLTYDEFSQSLPNPSTLAIINMDPLNGSAVMEIDPSLSFGIIDRLFGGKGEDPGYNRELTDIELSVIEGFIIRILPNLREAFSNVIDLKPKLGNIETNIQFAQIVPPNDMVILISMEVQIAEAKGFMNFCIPYITIEPLIPKLSAQYWYSSIRRSTGETNKAAGLISGMKAPSKLYFDTPTISVKHLHELKKGDELELPAAKDIELVLESGGTDVMSFCLPQLKAKKTSRCDLSQKGVISELSFLKKPEKKKTDTGLEDHLKSLTGRLKDELVQYIHPLKDDIISLKNSQVELRDMLSSDDEGKEEKAPVKKSLFERPFAFMNRIDNQWIVNFMSSEHPQTVTLVLSYLTNEKTAQCLSMFDHEMKTEVVKRMVTLDRTTPEVLREVERVLERKMETIRSNELSSAGGPGQAADVLNLTTRGVEKEVIEDLEKSAPDIAEEIKRRMFVFEDVVLLDEKSMDRFIDLADKDQIAMALKNVDEQVREKVYRHLPGQELDYLQKKMKSLGPVRLSEVEDAQQNLVNLIRRLEEDGEISIIRANEVIVE